MINIKKNTNYGYFNVSQQVFLRYRIADDFVYVVMKRHLCVESRLSALSAAILTSNGLIDRFSLWLPGCIMLYRVHLALVGFDLTMLVVICTDCTGSLNPTNIRSRPRRSLHLYMSEGDWPLFYCIMCEQY